MRKKIKHFLLNNGWSRKKKSQRSVPYLAPKHLSENDESQVYLPRKKFKGNDGYIYMLWKVYGTLESIYNQEGKDFLENKFCPKCCHKNSPSVRICGNCTHIF